MAAASMDDSVHEDKKGSPRGQDPPESADKQLPSPKAKMQGMPPYQQDQSQQYYGASSHTPEYRASPNGATPMSLPPIQHHFDGQAMQSQAQYVPAAHINGAPHMIHAPQYPPSIVSYQTQPIPPTMPSNAPSGQNGMMRFPIPPHGAIDARAMTGGRHKKEIKRRTKTGCLTCRKRRIKCDEAQPSCRNCGKSKRECLGYDPIFKQQAGPTNIKPAPSPTTLSAHLSTTPPVPSASYQTYPGTGGAFVPRPPESLYPYHQPPDSAPPTPESSSPDMAQTQGSPTTKLQPDRRVRVVAMDELYSLNDIPPPYEARNTSTAMSATDHQQLADFYGFHYAPGLDRLFETTWYSSRGFAYLTADLKLQDLTLQSMAHMRASDGRPNQEGAIASLEARLVWQLALMPRSKPAIVSTGDDAVTQEVLPRVAIMETLLTGNYLEPHLIPPPPTVLADRASEELKIKYNQQVFWHSLGKFCSLRDDQSASETADQVSRALSAMRGILSMLENRDVLYSIAIARHIGGRLPDWSPQRHSLHTTADHNDEATKLQVAYNFVEQEHQRGTTQVIQRICSMSLRSWALQKQH